MSRRRRVFLMCDYFAPPIWTYPRRDGIPLEDLPLTGATRAALERWAATYDKLLLDGTLEWAPGEFERFDREGRRLWRVVQTELGPRWKVGYMSEDGDIAWDPERPAA